jgi:hypothetical protein
LEDRYRDLFLVEDDKGSSTRIIFIKGLTSSGSCSSNGGSELEKRDKLVHDTQIHFPKSLGQSSYVDENDVIEFSWSGEYQDCQTGRSYTAEELAKMLTSDATDHNHMGDYRSMVPEAIYAKEVTCSGVERAAENLGFLMANILSRQPEDQFVLIGHSLGGMVAAYFLAEESDSLVGQRIKRVITIDSPLQGYHAAIPSWWCNDSETIADLRGQTRIVPSIQALTNSPHREKLLTLNSTSIGDPLENVENVDLDCKVITTGSGAAKGLILGIVGALTFNPAAVIAAAGLGAGAGLVAADIFDTYVQGHGCAFDDVGALRRIAGEMHDVPLMIR